ncbi:hypothetical protein L1987_61851 [Smallanthus sonchifolius]|uniref:Uncharacterized protein n=1 Tax=Smallanthus sonchifolius TaxID=185202 RepID=A0ACB9C8W4_9ASTR|nr:hypothetical protein L1987_61851 [Smallanthus sonchifolius]
MLIIILCFWQNWIVFCCVDINRRIKVIQFKRYKAKDLDLHNHGLVSHICWISCVGVKSGGRRCYAQLGQVVIDVKFSVSVKTFLRLIVDTTKQW